MGRGGFSELRRYVIYRSLQGGEFKPVGMEAPGINRFADYLGQPGQTARYKVVASDREYRASAFSNEASATTKPMSDEELLTMLQEACFRYYWEGAHPIAGMTLENIPGDDRIVATGASGFGIMALIVGVDRGFITPRSRARAADENCHLPGKGSSLPRRMVALHGWRHRPVDYPYLTCSTTPAIWSRLHFSCKACWPRVNTSMARASQSATCMHEFQSSGKRSSGTGIAARRKATLFTGIGRPSGPGTSVTGLPDSTRP